MAGGGVYYGAHALITPSLYGTDAMNIPKRCWMVPVLGVIAGHLLTKAPKIGAMGLGLAGGATAIGVEQIQMGISIKKNQAASGVSGFDAGALLAPSEARQLAGGVGAMEDGSDEAGVLWAPPSYRGAARHEAAGLSL